MKIILKNNVANLGFRDDIVSVKDGYARNYLIPKGLAILASQSAMKVRDENLKQRAHKEDKVKADAEAMANALAEVTLEVGAKVGEKGRIFGSVNSLQIANALKKMGYDIDRKAIVIKDEPIKEVGVYEATLSIHRDIKQTIKFEVVGE
jgi:large subunit ribosomal protein L9